MNKDVVDLVESLGGTVLFDGALIQFTDTTFMAALKKIYESGALEEREACAKLLEEAAQAAKDVDPQGFVWIAIKTSAEGIRERGKHD